GADRGPVPTGTPPDPGPAAAGLFAGRDRGTHRPAPRQRPPHPSHAGPPVGLRGCGMTASVHHVRPARLTHDVAEALAAELVGEMIQRWRQGERPLPEDFLAHHPELWDHPEAAGDLISAELCVLRQAG